MSPQGVTPSRVTPARKPRRAAKHRLASRRNAPGREQIVGLTAALAAAAGAVGFSHAAVAPNQTEPVAVEAPIGDAQQLDSITTARIERNRLASRDATRTGLVEATERIRHAAAVRQAKARAVKLAATRAQTQRRAAALASAKVAAQKAAEVKEAAAPKESAEKSTGATMMVAGYDITATFGQGGGRWARNHTGTDFAAPSGTRIGAVMAGEVISAEYSGAYGNRVEIEHSDGTVTTYCHMSSFAVSVGDSVAAGGKVGEVGTTGNSTGPHLHFEVVEDGVQIDPMPWLRDHGLEP